MGDLESYLENINNSPVFTLDREKEPAAYEREKNRLIENIYLYKIKENSRNEKFGLEIVETVGDCLRYYDPGKVPFMNYFNRAFAQRKSKAIAQNSIQKISGGIHYTRKEMEHSRAIHTFLQKHEELSSSDLITVLKDYVSEFDMSAEELAEAITTYTLSVTQSGDMELQEEEGFTLFDTISSGQDFTEEIISEETIQMLLELLETEYLGAGDKTKDCLSIILTNLCADWDRNGAYAELICSKAFYDSRTYETVLCSGKKLMNKEISKMTGKSEANLTQIWRRFQKKLKERMSR